MEGRISILKTKPSIERKIKMSHPNCKNNIVSMMSIRITSTSRLHTALQVSILMKNMRTREHHHLRISQQIIFQPFNTKKTKQLLPLNMVITILKGERTNMHPMSINIYLKIRAFSHLSNLLFKIIRTTSLIYMTLMKQLIGRMQLR